MKPQRLLTIAGQISNQLLLSRNDVEARMEREARSDSPVLSVYLDTDQSDEVNLKRGFEIMFWVLKKHCWRCRSGAPGNLF